MYFKNVFKTYVVFWFLSYDAGLRVLNKAREWYMLYH